MNAEELRKLPPNELILEIHRQVSLSVLMITSGDYVTIPDTGNQYNYLPLLSTEAFEVWPRGTMGKFLVLAKN